MNNREWLNSLASTDVPGLNAWMNAEHADDNPLTDSLMRGVVEHLGSEPGNGSEVGSQVGSKVGSEVDSRTQLIADIQAWLKGNVGFSVWLTDLMEQVRGWLDRQAAITERECASTRVNFAERVEFVSRIDELKAGRRRQAETIRRLSNENDEMKAFSERLETAAHDKLGVTLFGVDYVTEEFMLHVRDTLTAERDELKAANNRLQVALDAVEAERDEAIEAYDKHIEAHDAWHEPEDIKYTRNRFSVLEKAKSERIAKLEAERDELEAQVDELTEQRDRWRDNWCERNDSYSELASENDGLKERVDELQSKVDQLEISNRYGWECECKLQAERDYWRQEVQFCMDAAYPPSHAPERPYDPRVMAYPDREGCTTPSTLVSAMIDGLRDDVRDTVMPIVEESASFKADCERWREACGSMLDAAQEIQRIMREMEAK